ncbi:hypothetical protein BH09SUM1_BH09SUM1_23280 [soil metagenome]
MERTAKRLWRGAFLLGAILAASHLIAQTPAPTLAPDLGAFVTTSAQAGATARVLPPMPSDQPAIAPAFAPFPGSVAAMTITKAAIGHEFAVAGKVIKVEPSTSEKMPNRLVLFEAPDRIVMVVFWPDIAPDILGGAKSVPVGAMVSAKGKISAFREALQIQVKSTDQIRIEGIRSIPSPNSAALAPATVKLDPAMWSTSTSVSWARATRENRPLLVMFSTERASPYQHLRQIMIAEPTAAEALGKFECLRIDADQPAGAALVKKFNVMRVPCIVLLSPDGKELSRFITDANTKWAQVEEGLAAAK